MLLNWLIRAAIVFAVWFLLVLVVLVIPGYLEHVLDCAIRVGFGDDL